MMEKTHINTDIRWEAQKLQDPGGVEKLGWGWGVGLLSRARSGVGVGTQEVLREQNLRNIH